MTIKQNLLTSAGVKEAEEQILKELREKFDSDFRAYFASCQMEKIVGRIKKRLIPPETVKTLKKEHSKAVKEQKYFCVDGIRFFFRARKSHTFTGDAMYDERLKAFEEAKRLLEERKNEMIKDGSVTTKVSYVLECHGESDEDV